MLYGMMLNVDEWVHRREQELFLLSSFSGMLYCMLALGNRPLHKEKKKYGST